MDYKKKIGILLAYLFLMGFVIYTILPLAWMGSLSLKPVEEFFLTQKTFIPQNPTLGHYITLLTDSMFPRWMLNTVIVAGGGAGLSVVAASMAGYAFAFYEFKGKHILFLLAMSAIMVPIYILAVPWFLMFSELGLLNSYICLILPWGSWVFALFFMRVYIKSAVNPEVLEAARIDGASELSIFFRIVLPIVVPALVALSIVVFTQAFNSVFWPMVAMREPEMYTLPVGMATWKVSAGSAAQAAKWGLAVTGPLVSITPMLALFILFKDKFTKGLHLRPKG